MKSATPILDEQTRRRMIAAHCTALCAWLRDIAGDDQSLVTLEELDAECARTDPAMVAGHKGPRELLAPGAVMTNR